jgi:hypothetical protein
MFHHPFPHPCRFRSHACSPSGIRTPFPHPPHAPCHTTTHAFHPPHGSATSDGHLHFPRLPFPVPFWYALDSSLSHSLLAISPLLQSSGSCLLTPTTLSIFAPGDPTPLLVGSKRASENVWRLHIPILPLPTNPLIPSLLTMRSR